MQDIRHLGAGRHGVFTGAHPVVGLLVLLSSGLRHLLDIGRAEHHLLHEPHHPRAGEALLVGVEAHYPVLLLDPGLDGAGLDHGENGDQLRPPGGQVRWGQGDEGAGESPDAA